MLFSLMKEIAIEIDVDRQPAFDTEDYDAIKTTAMM